MYFDIYFFCVHLSDQYLSLASPKAAVPQQKSMSGLFQEEFSDQYMTRASITHCSTLHKFPDTETRSPVGRDCPQRPSNRSGHLPWERRARSDSESLFSTAMKPRLGLEMRERSQGCTQTCHTADLTNRNYAETSKMDLSQPPDPDI